MTLSYLGLPCESDLRDTFPTKSVWTIDLCLLLKRQGIKKLTFCTTCVGVNPSHSGLSYYSSLENDRARVQRAFEEAPLAGVKIVDTAAPLDYIISRLKEKASLFIVLVDVNLLVCTNADEVRGGVGGDGSTDPEGGQRASLKATCGYRGHYILLCDYDSTTQRVKYMDPQYGSCKGGCEMDCGVLECARTASGTDNDLIEIINAQR